MYLFLEEKKAGMGRLHAAGPQSLRREPSPGTEWVAADAEKRKAS